MIITAKINTNTNTEKNELLSLELSKIQEIRILLSNNVYSKRALDILSLYIEQKYDDDIIVNCDLEGYILLYLFLL